jgi:hypothetical protein
MAVSGGGFEGDSISEGLELSEMVALLGVGVDVSGEVVRAEVVGGVDLRAGRERVRDALARWLLVRRTTVAVKTFRADQDVARLTPTSLLALQLTSVSGREVARAFELCWPQGCKRRRSCATGPASPSSSGGASGRSSS